MCGVCVRVFVCVFVCVCMCVCSNYHRFSLPRFFFKSYCEDIEAAVMEELSDDEIVLPLYEGKIIGRVEVVS